MTRYLFDTTALAEVLKRAPSRRFVRRLTMIPPGDRWTTAVGVAELLYAARRNGSATLMSDVVSLVSSVRVAPFDLAAAQAYAKVRPAMERPGSTAGPIDMLTAAVAKSGDFILVTHHPARFAGVPGLYVEDWTSSEPSLNRSRPAAARNSRPPAHRRTPAPQLSGRQSRPPRR